MMAAAFNRASVGFLFCVAAAASVPAQAQNYDSAGLLRFGFFDTILGQRLKTSDTLSGWTVGAGVEYEWAREMVFFGEYMFASFDNFTVREGNGGSFTTSEDQSVLRLGVKFKIGYDFREGPVW